MTAITSSAQSSRAAHPHRLTPLAPPPCVLSGLGRITSYTEYKGLYNFKTLRARVEWDFRRTKEIMASCLIVYYVLCSV